jgi:hypothetical protein
VRRWETNEAVAYFEQDVLHLDDTVAIGPIVLFIFDRNNVGRRLGSFKAYSSGLSPLTLGRRALIPVGAVTPASNTRSLSIHAAVVSHWRDLRNAIGFERKGQVER